MRDMHCHILPGVDDGARDMRESLAMLDAAVEAGVSSMVCTPHCRKPWFDFEAMWSAYDVDRRSIQNWPGKRLFQRSKSKSAAAIYA